MNFSLNFQNEEKTTEKTQFFPALGAGLIILFAALILQMAFQFILKQSFLGWGAQNKYLQGLFSFLALGIPALGAANWGRLKRTIAYKEYFYLHKPKGNLCFTLLATILSASGLSIVLTQLSNIFMSFYPMPLSLRSIFSSLMLPQWDVFFLIAFCAPLGEELLFRGVLLKGFSSHYSAVAAVFMTSALFALFHLNPWQAVGAFIAGLYLGTITLKTRSLLPALVFHILFNSIPLFLSLIHIQIVGYNVTLAGAGFQSLSFFFLGVFLFIFGFFLHLASFSFFLRR